MFEICMHATTADWSPAQLECLPKSDGQPKSMNKLTLNKPEINMKL